MTNTGWAHAWAHQQSHSSAMAATRARTAGPETRAVCEQRPEWSTSEHLVYFFTKAC
jgi:hypothetical protein